MSMRQLRIRFRQALLVLLRLAGRRFARVTVRGRPLWVDLRDRTLGAYFFIHQDYGPFEASLLERAAAPGGTAVDVGANVGFYTVLLGPGWAPRGG